MFYSKLPIIFLSEIVSSIDFTYARQKIAEDQEESLRFLEETLEKCK